MAGTRGPRVCGNHPHVATAHPHMHGSHPPSRGERPSCTHGDLPEWQRYVPAKRLLVLRSEDYFARPLRAVKRIWRLLQLPTSDGSVVRASHPLTSSVWRLPQLLKISLGRTFRTSRQMTLAQSNSRLEAND